MAAMDGTKFSNEQIRISIGVHTVSKLVKWTVAKSAVEWCERLNLYDPITNILKEFLSHGKCFFWERNPFIINPASVKVWKSGNTLKK